MKNYIGTKIVQAAPAVRIGGTVYLLDEPIPAVSVVPDYGYKVVYPDGYESFCPTVPFEMAYRPFTGLTFGQAIEALRIGKAVARAGWNGKGIFLQLQNPDINSKMTHPYIYIDTTGLQTDNSAAPKDRVPWLASQTDMLAYDWMVVE